MLECTRASRQQMETAIYTMSSVQTQCRCTTDQHRQSKFEGLLLLLSITVGDLVTAIAILPGKRYNYS